MFFGIESSASATSNWNWRDRAVVGDPNAQSLEKLLWFLLRSLALLLGLVDRAAEDYVVVLSSEVVADVSPLSEAHKSLLIDSVPLEAALLASFVSPGEQGLELFGELRKGRLMDLELLLALVDEEDDDSGLDSATYAPLR